MARRRSGFQKKIDHVAWDGFSLTQNALAAGIAAQTFLTQALDRPVTSMRIRGTAWGFVDGLEAPGVSATISMGIIKVPEGTGSTVVYDPVADDKAPWLWYTSFHLAYEEYVTDVIDCPGMTSYREVIDNKAMRIVRPDEELQFVVENTTVVGALSANVGITGRSLNGF